MIRLTAAKILNDVVEQYSSAEVLLVVVTKRDTLEDTADASSYTISPRRLEDPFAEASPNVKTTNSPMFSLHRVESQLMPTPENKRRLSETVSLARSHRTNTGKTEACSLQRVAALMSHPSLLQKSWCAFYTSALTGKGLEEASTWLIDTLNSYYMT